MKIEITDKQLRDLGITQEEFFLLLFFGTGKKLNSTIESLIRKDLLTSDIRRIVTFINPNGRKLIEDANVMEIQESEYTDVAKKLKELYPKGMKSGQYPWTEGVKLICRRLAIFEKKYGKYTDEQILNAAESYIKSFNGVYTYMKTLKYFIFSERANNGTVEPTSDLLTFIENAGQEDELSQDWTTTLV